MAEDARFLATKVLSRAEEEEGRAGQGRAHVHCARRHYTYNLSHRDDVRRTRDLR